MGLIAATAATYFSSLGGAFVFDDQGAILDNVTIRDLSALDRVLSPPIEGLPVTGRPITNLSLAINYALGGADPWGYHVVNGLIHLVCGLLLFGVVRRTLVQPRFEGRFAARADVLAGVAALLWLVHPLQTAAVTYISQRAESLASACMLGALYAFIRALDSRAPCRWLAVSVMCGWMGMGAKEIAALLPVIVVLYDRTFVGGAWRTALVRWPLYLVALAAAWVPLGWLVVVSENRGGTWAGDAGYTPLEYLLIQAGALIHYLRLVLWPHPLLFDYGRTLAVPAWWAVLPHGLALLALIGVTVRGVVRGAAAGFLGVCFFGILAPTSSFIPIADPIFEHRMYLPSAVIIAGLVVFLGERWWRSLRWVVGPVVLVLGALTIIRNHEYAFATGLWQDTVEKRPDNARAWGNLGNEHMHAGRPLEALPCFEMMYQLTPHAPLAAHNLAVALDALGRRTEAISRYREALVLQPRNFLARTNLAGALAAEGALVEAFAEYEAVLRDTPDFVDAHRGYARALLRVSRVTEAILHFERAAALSPQDPEAHFNLGDALARARRLAEAAAAFRRTRELQPGHVAALNNLGNALLLSNDTPGAIEAFHAALEAKPDPMTHTNLGMALLVERRKAEAQAQFQAALKLAPDYAPAQAGLRRAQSTGVSP